MSDATIHATCVAIGDAGVLIVGPSGSGKSDLALRLIDRGAVLVSDDYTRLEVQGDHLVASAPDAIAGRIEIRGVGIVTRPYLSCVPIALTVDLARAPDRLPEPATAAWLGRSVSVIGLNGLEPSAPIKVEAALALHGLTLPCRP